MYFARVKSRDLHLDPSSIWNGQLKEGTLVEFPTWVIFFQCDIVVDNHGKSFSGHRKRASEKSQVNCTYTWYAEEASRTKSGNGSRHAGRLQLNRFSIGNGTRSDSNRERKGKEKQRRNRVAWLDWLGDITRTTNIVRCCGEEAFRYLNRKSEGFVHVRAGKLLDQPRAYRNDIDAREGTYNWRITLRNSLITSQSRW